ncbi:hypothetical protein [Stutzerimonas stutzeri]|uniref:hypothetical protein n=1 Tax=Stutzerimonas stutzeri TaxID=316 RepID=UPI00265CA1B0|nr:hypothetical protein [Stutzerimonas stutzeri]MCF6783356.1 hypothetical protein [Stutzerimonas stutzeri]
MYQDDLKADLKAGVTEGACYLYQMGSLLRSKRFHRFYREDQSRFAWATAEVFARLRRDLTTQLTQALTGAGASSVPAVECMLELAEQCERQADAMAAAAQAKIRKADRSLKIAAGPGGAMDIVTFLSRTTMPDFVRYDSPRNQPAAVANFGFYQRNALLSLITFVQAVDTLRYPLANPAFERILADVETDWLLEGYPHDLLAYDASNIRQQMIPKAIAVRHSYCATHFIDDSADCDPACPAPAWYQVAFG